MKELKVCINCNTELTEENAVEFNGKVFCQDCFEEKTVVCRDCGVRVWRYDSYELSEDYLCPRCRDSYEICERCGCLIEEDEGYNLGDEIYCQSCYDYMKNETIHSYNYKPSPCFYGEGPFYYGIELEVDYGGEDSDNANELLGIGNCEEERIYIKHDGSLEEGFEIVSHPMTLDYHQESMNWKELFDRAIEMNYRSHQTGTCGLHCHVNRTAFGETPKEQEEVIARIVYFVEAHWNELLKFSRRTENAINRWASRYGLTGDTQITYKNAKDKRMGRYVAVNLENYHTVEFRMFRGTLKHETFMAVLQLVDEICKVCKAYSDSAIERLSWGEFVLNIKEKPELVSFLKSRRLYVNEPSEEGGEI